MNPGNLGNHSNPYNPKCIVDGFAVNINYLALRNAYEYIEKGSVKLIEAFACCFGMFPCLWAGLGRICEFTCLNALVCGAFGAFGTISD